MSNHISSKVRAVYDIIAECRRDTVRKSSHKTMTRALSVIGLDDAERLAVLTYLDICKSDGTPWNPNA